MYCNREAGFEVIHGLLNRVMEVLGVPLEGAGEAWFLSFCLCVYVSGGGAPGGRR